MMDSKNTKPNLKLPDFTIPKFDGKIESWEKFRDFFEAIISKTNLSGVAKLLYLIGSCEGYEAANVLSGFEICEENFELAWKDRKEKYNNDRFLVDKHFSEMLKCKPVSKDSPEELKRLPNCFSSRIKQLKRSIENPDLLWALMMVHLVCYRLDVDNRKSWESKLKKASCPTGKKWKIFSRKNVELWNK
jgi:hypothetical protein